MNLADRHTKPSIVTHPDVLPDAAPAPDGAVLEGAPRLDDRVRAGAVLTDPGGGRASPSQKAAGWELLVYHTPRQQLIK